MSFTDNAEPVQPEEGQGDTGTPADSPYSEYLNRIEDAEARSVAEEGFKAFDANTTKKFTEYANERKQWEPYQQLGLTDRDPQQVQWALQVAELAQTDPAAFAKWASENYGETQTAPQADEFAFEDPTQKQLEQLLEQRLSPLQQMMEQYGQRFEMQEQQQAQRAAVDFIEGQMKELEAKHGDEFDREALELYLDHFTNSARSVDDLQQAVPKAFEALQSHRSKWEKASYQKKVDAPNPAEGGGVPNMTPEKLSGLRGPGSAMEEAQKILRQSFGQ